MPNEIPGSLIQIITAASSSELTNTPAGFGLLADDLLYAIAADPVAVRWLPMVLVANHGPGGLIRGRLRDAQRRVGGGGGGGFGITSSSEDSGEVRDNPSAEEMQEAEANLRSRLPEIVRQLPEIETAADGITRDRRMGRVIERVSAIVKETAESRLSPFAMLIILWWLLGMASANEVAALAVWYAIARDVYKKDND
jgi:hypothetical protein